MIIRDRPSGLKLFLLLRGSVLPRVLPTLVVNVVVATLVSLAGLGALGAYAGGAPKLRATARVLFWGAAAMAITAGVGSLFGAVV